MTRFLTIATILFIAFSFTGCEAIADTVLKEQIDAVEARLDELEEPNEATDTYTQEEIDAMFATLEPTQIERFMDDFFLSALADGDLIFMEDGVPYAEEVEAYGYSSTYIYEATEPVTVEFRVQLGNDLEMCYYPEGIAGESVCEDLSGPGLLGGGRVYSYIVDLEAGFFVIDFESWDDEENSTLTITIGEVVEDE